jgi:putative membrane protein
MRNTGFALGLLVALLLLWMPLAIAPWDRHDWLLENALLVLGVVVLAGTWRLHSFSRASCVLIFVFACLHTVGAHYTYAEVPYDDWMRSLTGRTFNSMVGWQRNNFDRVVHFLYGLLLAYPVRELLLRAWNLRGFAGYLFALDLTMSSSMLYELIEWAAATFFGGDLGMAYLGTQGDVWDAHKDMALASLGALITVCALAAMQRALGRDFAAEWVDSGRVGEARRQRP